MGRLQGLWPVGAMKREERIDLVPSCWELRVRGEKAMITNGSLQTVRNMKIVCDIHVWCFAQDCSSCLLEGGEWKVLLIWAPVRYHCVRRARQIFGGCLVPLFLKRWM